MIGGLEQLALYAPGILAALTVHEYAHGQAAWHLGDPTARRMGRLTLNPLAHLDVVGTILLFLVHFGWAKPVPIDPYYFRKPRRDIALVSAAGPAANIAAAAAGGWLMQVLVAQGWMAPFGPGFLMLNFAVFINLMLAFFNLLPIPPLDGAKVVAGFLPGRFQPFWQAFERVGFLVLMGLILLGSLTGVSVFGRLILPVSHRLHGWFTGSAGIGF